MKFATDREKEFMRELKERIATYFEERGISDKADRRMVSKAVVVVLLTFVPYGLILTGWFSPWWMLGLAVVMGIGTAGIGFCIAHDALHGAYSSSRR